MLAIALGLAALAAGWLLGILPLALYSAAVFGLAALAGGLSIKARVALMIALPTIHISWGAGFIVGFLRGAQKTIDRSRVSK